MKSQGFTLIEVQISVVILVLIVSLLMGNIYLSNKSVKAVRSQSKDSSEIRIVTRLVSEQISSILPLSASGRTNELIFKGSHSDIYYMGYLPEHVVKGGPWLIHIYRDRESLILSYKVFDSRMSVKANFTAEFHKVVLLDNLNKLTINYQLGSNTWTSAWTNTRVLPASIKVQINNGNPWPDIIVPIHAYTAVENRLHIVNIE